MSVHSWLVQRTAVLELFAAAARTGIIPANFRCCSTLQMRGRLGVAWQGATKGFEMLIDFCQAANHINQNIFAFFRCEWRRPHFWIGVVFMEQQQHRKK